MLADEGEEVGTDESTNLTGGSGKGVVMTSDTSSAGLGCQETDVVTWAKLTKRQEDAVHDGETRNVSRGGEVVVLSSHGKGEDTLQEDTDGERISWTNPVRENTTKHGTGDVE